MFPVFPNSAVPASRAKANLVLDNSRSEKTSIQLLAYAEARIKARAGSEPRSSKGGGGSRNLPDPQKAYLAFSNRFRLECLRFTAFS